MGRETERPEIPSRRRRAPLGRPAAALALDLAPFALIAVLLMTLPPLAGAPDGAKAAPADPVPPPIVREFQGTVSKIVDGDTFYVAGEKIRIRLWGLDAPEMDDPGGAAAKRALSKIAEGAIARCAEVDRDRFQRIVARCFTADGADITALMIRSGTAKEYLRFTKGYYARLE
jgi:endonuclease YncB( thermonuclease family)